MKTLDFPELIQTFEYDCWAKAIQAVLAYYGIEIFEEHIIKRAKTNPKDWTTTQWILKIFKKYWLKYDSQEMEIDNLKKYIDKRIPIIILLQAWNDKITDYTNNYKDWHRVVVIWYDNNKIYFEDPYAFKRTFLTYQELNKRRHSKENWQKIFNHWIAIYGKPTTFDSKKIIHMK